MNTLKTVVEQIETFGKFKQEVEVNNCILKYYRIDAVTTAIIHCKYGEPFRVSFVYI